MAAVKVPANVELKDRLAFGLTAKQLGILAATAVSAYGSFLILAPLMPAPVAVAAMAVVAAGGVLLALVRHDGLDGDQLALALARYLRTPKRQLLAPEGLPAKLPAAPRQPKTAPLDIPVRRVLASGLIELADGSHCRLLSARGASFELRSDQEQAAYVAAFERFLNGLAEPVQLDVRSERVSLRPQAEQVEAAAARSSGGLRTAALDHAAFLRELSETQALHRRRIVLVLRSRESRPDVAEVTLTRRIGEATELLQGAEIALVALGGEEVARLLACTLDPPGPIDGSHLQGVIHAQSDPQNDSTNPGSGGGTDGPRRGAARSGRARAARRSRSRRRPLAADARDQRLSA